MRYQNPIAKLFRRPYRTVSILRLILLWAKTYFTTQNRLDPDEATIIETDLDDRIPAQEGAIYPYLFACVYILFTSWYVFESLTREQYRKCQKAFEEMIWESQRIFLEVPTTMRNRRRSEHPLALYTQQVDGPTNCYPSLHVALVMLSYQMIKDTLDQEDLLRVAMRTSCVDICRSTLLIKQHSVIDIVGGIELARKRYHTYFEGEFEELLDEIVPELEPEELTAIAELTGQTPDLIELLRALLNQRDR